MHSDDARRLKICWVDTMRYSQPLSQSQARKWQRLTEDLHVDIEVLSFAPGLMPQRFVEYAHFTQWPALPLAILRYLTAYMLVPPLVCWLIVRGRADVLIAHDPYIGAAAALGKRMARIFGRRSGLVIETRGDLEQAVFMQRSMQFQSLWRRLMRAAAGYALQRADALRAVSQSSAEQIAALAPDIPLMTFMSWTDSAVFEDIVPEQPVSQRCDIVYTGVLVPRKGVHVLLDALAAIAAEIPQARLWIIGSAANPDYAAQLRDQIDRLKLRDRVTFVDHVPQAELAAHMAAARVVVLPTFSEGMPKVVIEAMLCGTPVVASAVDGIPEVLQDGVQGFLVPPGDAVALADALRRIFGDAPVDQLGQQARDFARSYYSPTQYVESYGQLFALAYQQAHKLS